MATAPAQSVLAPQAQIDARAFDLMVPLAAALPNPASMIAYSGRTVAQDRAPKIVDYTGHVMFPTSSVVLTSPGLRWAGGGLITYRPEAGGERRVQIQDNAITGQLNSATDRVNTTDKWAGKFVWNVTTQRPVFATGTTATSTWVYADGATAHTPV